MEQNQPRAALGLLMASRRVQRRAHNPVGESPTGAKRLKPRSWGGAMAREQDGEALRQVISQGNDARPQAATYSERRSSLVTHYSGGRDGLQRAKAARAVRKESDTAVLTGGVTAVACGQGLCVNWRSPRCPAKKSRRVGDPYNREWEVGKQAPGWRIGL